MQEIRLFRKMKKATISCSYEYKPQPQRLINGLQSMREVPGFFIAAERKKYMHRSGDLLSPPLGITFFNGSLAVPVYCTRNMRENIDEPASNLDPKSRRYFINLLKKFMYKDNCIPLI